MITLERQKQNLQQYVSTSIYDRSANSDQYFRVFNIPSTLAIGKNLVRINYNKDTLCPKSTIYIEFIDSNGNPLYHEILGIETDDGSKLISVYVYPDTPTGKVTMWVAGKALVDVNSGRRINSTNDINLVWCTSINITTLKQNNTEVYFTQDPQVEFYEKLVPYYTNTTASIGRQTLLGSTSSSIFLDSVVSPYQFSGDNSKFTTTTDVSKKVIIDPDFSSGKGNTRSLVKLPQYGNIQTISSQNFSFTPEMEGGLLILNNISIVQETPRDAIDSSSFTTTTNYSASIVKVLNNNTIQVDKQFYYSLDYSSRDGTTKTFSTNRIKNHSQYITASYYSPGTMSRTAATESFVTFNIKNVEPAGGTVDKLKIKYKPIGSFGEFIDVGEFAITEQNLLTDSGSLYQTPRLGLIEKEIGFVKSQADITSYWTLNSSSYGGSVSIISTSSKVTDAIAISHAGINLATKYITVHPNLTLPAIANTEYKLSLRTFIDTDLSGSLANQLDIYISGSSINTDIIKNTAKVDPIKSLTYGTYIGSITNETRDTDFFFRTIDSKNIKPIFIIRSGNWTLGQIGIYPRKELGFSPNFIKLNIPTSLFRRKTDMVVNIDYLNEDGIKANTFTRFSGLNLTGSNVIITERDNQFTGSFSGSYQGDGRLLTVSWSNMVGTPTGLISSSIDTSSFVLNAATASMLNPYLLSTNTGSFALKTNISGAFDSTSGSITTRITTIENTRLFSSATSSLVFNSSTSSFAINTNISGAFDSASYLRLSQAGSMLSPYALIANISGAFNGITSSFVTNNQTSSFVRNEQTGGFATTGSNTYVGNQTITGSINFTGSIDGNGMQYLKTDATGSLWGILKVRGETTASANLSSGSRGPSVGTNFGEFEVAGTVSEIEDIASIKYIYGLQIDPTSSVSFDVKFPIFKNTKTGINYGTSGSRNGFIATNINLLIFISASILSTQPSFVWARNYGGRFQYTSTTVTMSSDFSSTSIGSASFNDSYINSVAQNMSGAPGVGTITLTAPYLTIPVRFISGDGRNYGLKIAATCEVTKCEFL